MTKTQIGIMRHFRQYRIGANQMLCFNASLANSDASRFQLAMASLIQDGLVNKERPKRAYSLTPDGFLASLSA
jgi:hypothetical protein